MTYRWRCAACGTQVRYKREHPPSACRVRIVRPVVVGLAEKAKRLSARLDSYGREE